MENVDLDEPLEFGRYVTRCVSVVEGSAARIAVIFLRCEVVSENARAICRLIRSLAAMRVLITRPLPE